MMHVDTMRLYTRRGLSVLALSALLLAGCGDDNGDSDEAATTSPAGTSSPGTSAGSATGADGATGTPHAAAVARFEELSTAPTATNIPTEPLSALPDPGSTIYIIGPLQIPTAAFFAAEFTEAMNVLGITDVQEFSFAPGTDELTARLDQAVQDKPDGVFLIGAPEQLVSEQVSALEAAGTFVVTSGSREKDSSTPGHNGYDLSVQVGKDVVATAVANLPEDEEEIVIVHGLTNQLPVFVAGQRDGFEQGIAEYCPDTCRVENFEFTLQEQFEGQLPGKVVTFLQATPDADVLFWQGANASVGVAEALDTAGIDIFHFGQTGDPRNWQAVKDGAEDGILQQSLALVTWREADLLARLLVGDDITEANADNNPFQWLTAETVPDPATEVDFVPFPDFKDQVKELWGV